jgi:hypothetical protein
MSCSQSDLRDKQIRTEVKVRSLYHNNCQQTNKQDIDELRITISTETSSWLARPPSTKAVGTFPQPHSQTRLLRGMVWCGTARMRIALSQIDVLKSLDMDLISM